MIPVDIIWLAIGFALGYVIGVNNNRSKAPAPDSKFAEELQVARNLNKSLLDDKNELQEKLWKLQGKKPK